MSMTNPDSADAGTPWVAHYPADLKWDTPLDICPVGDLLDRTAARFPDRYAFYFLGARLRWGEVGNAANRMAKGLQELGVAKGVKVGLFLPNSPTYLIAYYAVLKAGGTVVNFNPLYSVKEIAHQIEDSHADFMITLDIKMLCDKLLDILPRSRLKGILVGHFAHLLPFPKNLLYPLVKHADVAKLPRDERIFRLDVVMQNDGAYTPATINPQEDIAVLQYTGGTTGVPKGAMLTHANITANVHQSCLYLKMDGQPEYKMLGVIPFFHVFAMTAVMNLSVLGGFEIVALPRFDLDDTLKLINRTRPDIFPAVPAIYNAINHYKNLAQYDLRSIKICVSGGAPLPVEVKKQFEQLTGCVVCEGYGLTEASPVLCVNPPSGENRAGSIGMPLPGTVVEIISADDRKTRMPVGERGELCARGPQVMKGYWQHKDATDDVLVDGMLHTGDIAIMDKDGYFYIVDRIKDMIITNGYKVYPRNVEEAIYAHPAVEECIVAGLPDAARGEVVKAWIKPKDGATLTEAEMKIFLEDKISKMEMPKHIEIRATPLPKTMIGKLSRKDILAQESRKA